MCACFISGTTGRILIKFSIGSLEKQTKKLKYEITFLLSDSSRIAWAGHVGNVHGKQVKKGKVVPVLN
jgi:hypothetical protein